MGTPILSTLIHLSHKFSECPSDGPPGEWVLTDMTDSSLLGKRWRIREKEAKLSQATHTSPRVVMGKVIEHDRGDQETDSSCGKEAVSRADQLQLAIKVSRMCVDNFFR